jgi:hypothetical protein
LIHGLLFLRTYTPRQQQANGRTGKRSSSVHNKTALSLFAGGRITNVHPVTNGTVDLSLFLPDHIGRRGWRRICVLRAVHQSADPVAADILAGSVIVGVTIPIQRRWGHGAALIGG